MATYPQFREFYSVSNGMLCSEQKRINSSDDPMVKVIKSQLDAKQIFTTSDEAIRHYKQLPKKEDNSNLPSLSDFIAKTDNDKQLLKIIRNYIVEERYNDEKTNGLFFIGGCGIGKTFSMQIIYNELRKKKIKGVFKNTNEIVDEIKNSFGTELSEEQIINKYQQAKILFLDDFGSEMSTEFTRNVIYRIINYRYNHHLPTIISSNYTKKELDNNKDIELERIVSRIKDQSITVIFSGKAKREQKVIEV